MAELTFTFDGTSGLFTSSAGEEVTAVSVRNVVSDTLAEMVSREVLPLGVAFQKGEIDAVTWALEMERVVKTSQTMGAAAALGGWQQVTQSQWGKVAGYVKEQYSFLDNLFRLVQSEDFKLDGDFLRRAAMYVRDALTTFENIRRFAGDHTEERRLLLPGAIHCDDCIFYANQNWQPRGVLPDIGDECQCISNCQCGWEFR